VQDEGEVQRSVEAITEIFRSYPLLGTYILHCRILCTVVAKCFKLSYKVIY